MAHFEIVEKYLNKDIHLPERKTARSAGYDFEVAKDMTLSPYKWNMEIMEHYTADQNYKLNDFAKLTKDLGTKPDLVPTGVKCKLADDEYLELSIRSSCPLKHWLILANGVGIIDSDYYNNPDNEGEIFFQIINLSPFNIDLKKGDRIGQGIIHKYIVTEDDAATGERMGGFGSTQ